MSNDSVLGVIAEGVVHAIVDLFLGIERGGEDLFFPKEREKNWQENARALGLIKDGALNMATITEVIRIILEHVRANLNDKQRKKFDNSIERFLGGAGLKMGSILVTKRVAAKIAQTMVAKQLTALGVSKGITTYAGTATAGTVTALGFYGVIERAANASDRLKKNHPALHAKLKQGDLDMAYFVVEDATKPFLVMLDLARNNPQEFDYSLEIIGKGLDEAAKWSKEKRNPGR